MRPRLVANKVQPASAEISKADFEASIERPINIQIAYDQKAASNAAKLGQTFAAANASSKATAGIKQLANRIVNTSGEEAADGGDAGGDKKSLLGSFDLKSLLAKKDKKAAPAAQ